MRVIVGCECSQRTTMAFRRLGHDAWSCDIKPTMGDPRFHLHGDVFSYLDMGWDLGIFHPDCTYLTNSAEWCYKDDPGKNMRPGVLFGQARRDAREAALDFVRRLLDADIEKIALENPQGVIGTRIRKADQYIQPYEFGDDASKRTGLWLKNLPLLKPTKRVPGRIVQSGPYKGKERWANQTDSGQNRLGPSPDRAMIRAMTYPGWSEAMAQQWGGVVPVQNLNQLSLF